MRKRIGLAIMRTQPLHKGHTGIISRMVEECESVILALGSADVYDTIHDPWHVDLRQQMARNVYGNRLKIIHLTDLGATEGTTTWCDYVLDKIAKVGLPEPTDYYTGSEADAVWYRERFYNLGFSPEPGTERPHTDFHTSNETLRLLHIQDRIANLTPAATELRMFLQTRNDGWKRWVPAVNHELVETTYPEKFRVRL